MTSAPGKGPPGIERDLEMLFTATEALRELASDPDKAQDGARIYDFNVRWGTLMSGRLIRLEHYYRGGSLRRTRCGATGSSGTSSRTRSR